MYSLAVKIAMASLVRRATRSFLVMLMICVSLWGLLLMQGIYDGMTEQMITNAIRSDSGQLSIFAEGYRLDPGLDKLVAYTLEEQERLETFLNRHKTVVKTRVRRLRQNGLVATAHYSRNTEIFGIDLEGEKKHGNLQNYLILGKYDFGSRQKGAIIGFKLAEKLQVGVGKKIILSAQDKDNEVTSVALKVTGIIKTNNMNLDENVVFLDLEKCRSFLGVQRGVSQISVMMYDEKLLPQLQKDLQNTFPYEILRWDEMYPALMQSRVLMKGFSLMVSGMIFGVAGLGIFGVIMVSVLERIREFGVMLAIGTSFNQVRIIILAESLFMGLSGFVAGSICGGLSLLYFNKYGLDLTVFSDAFSEFGMDAVTYAVIRPEYFSTAFAAVILATLLSTWFPLRLLKKARPIEVIHE